ncbi:MAG: hypothetical protein ABR611_05495, partial [Chthoniobacterales bacterium]
RKAAAVGHAHGLERHEPAALAMLGAVDHTHAALTEQLEEVSSMDNLLKIVQRAGNDLLQADEYLARVGVKTMPAPRQE